MRNYIYHSLDIYTSTFVKIFMCVGSEKKSLLIFDLHHQVPKYHGGLKKQRILLKAF